MLEITLVFVALVAAGLIGFIGVVVTPSLVTAIGLSNRGEQRRFVRVVWDTPGWRRVFRIACARSGAIDSTFRRS